SGRLVDLEKPIERLKALGSEASGAWAGLIAQAKSLAAMGQFADANDRLMEAWQLLWDAVEQAEAAQGQPTPPPTEQQAPTDEAAQQAEYERRVLALEPKVLEAEKTRKGQAKWLTLFMSAQDRGSEGEFAKAIQILDKLEDLLKAPTETNGKAAAALQQWQAACTEVTMQLRKFQAEITKEKDVNSAKAVLRLESIVKNLAQQPSTQQDVVELERWIGDDELIK